MELFRVKKNAFTIIELLSVIVILGIILAIAIPTVQSLINNSKQHSYEVTVAEIIKGAKRYMIDNSDQIPNLESTGIGYIKLTDLINANFFTGTISDPRTGEPLDSTAMVKVTDLNNGEYSYEFFDSLTTDIQSPIANKPVLAQGMIPVYYDNAAGVWKIADSINPNYQWYDYNNQKWANTVTVSNTYASDRTASVGTQIPMSHITTMWVWVPRYKYAIPSGSGAREIAIIFENGTRMTGTGTTSPSTQTLANLYGNVNHTDYITHPAFNFGETPLKGIWVGKFETTGTITSPTILPDTLSIRSQTLNTMYNSVKTYMQGSSTYGFSNDNDIHMMKNTEWGAVTYLYYSKYGKYGNLGYTGANKELYINNSSSFYTGRSSGAAGGSGIKTPTSEYISAGYYTYDGKCATINVALPAPCNSGSTGQNLTDKTLSYGASTTGNIYGIYDMSGGAFEYVMGVYEPNPIPATGISDSSGYSSVTTNSQYDLLTINSKYYNRYLTNSELTGAILGDATKEVSGWYADSSGFVYATFPWFLRGGSYINGSIAGAFSSSDYTGAMLNDRSFRVVMLNGTGL